MSSRYKASIYSSIKRYIDNLYGLVVGKRHSSCMLVIFGALPQLQLHARTPNDNSLCVYSDPVYPLRFQWQEPFKGNLN